MKRRSPVNPKVVVVFKDKRADGWRFAGDGWRSGIPYPNCDEATKAARKRFPAATVITGTDPGFGPTSHLTSGNPQPAARNEE